MSIVLVPCLAVRSFTEGDTQVFAKVRRDDDTVLAEALWFQNHGRPERADEVLEAYCQRFAA